MISEILLRRKNLVVVPMRGENKENIRIAMSIAKNVERYGYTLSPKLMIRITGLDDIEKFYSGLIRDLKFITGDDKKYYSMYDPDQVCSMDEAELYWNAIVHYISGGMLYPDVEHRERLPLLDSPDLKVIDSCLDYAPLLEIYGNLLASKTSLSLQDKADIKEIYEHWEPSAPDEIPNKESVAFYCKLVTERNKDNKCKEGTLCDVVLPYLRTATDVLRYITALSDGDVSLARNTRFIKLPRYLRRFIMLALSECPNLIEDMFRNRERWLRVAEIIHPAEWRANQYYKKVCEAFDRLYNDDKPEFFHAKLNRLIEEGNFDEAIDLLKTRPGEFARNLDRLLRKYPNYKVLDAFEKVAEDVSSPVLWQVRGHFSKRNDNQFRVIFPKNGGCYVMENNLPYIRDYLCDRVKMICMNALHLIYAKREPLGNVRIDQELLDYAVPFAQRNASSGKLITRGSSFPFYTDAKIIRPYIWWTNTKDGTRVDIDLSVGIYDECLRMISHVSYTNLKNDEYGVYHSGDITNGGDFNGDGVAEFIDIDIDRVVSAGARYVVTQVYSFCFIPFNKLNVSFGWMMREGYTGETFEPKTSQANFGISSESCKIITAIFDCKERKVVWADIPVMKVRGLMNLESNLQYTDMVLYGILNHEKPNMFDVALENAIARGNITDGKADIVFSAHETGENVITPYDLDYWVAEMI